MYDIDDPLIVNIMLASRDSPTRKWSRRMVQNALENLERFSEDEIDEILDWYRGWYN